MPTDTLIGHDRSAQEDMATFSWRPDSETEVSDPGGARAAALTLDHFRAVHDLRGPAELPPAGARKVDQLPDLTIQEKELTDNFKLQHRIDERNQVVVLRREVDAVAVENSEIRRGGDFEAWNRHLTDRLGVHEPEQLDALRTDTVRHFMKPDSARSGEAVEVASSGEIRRPILDITLDEQTRNEVAQVIERRSRGLDGAIAALRSAAGADEITQRAVLDSLVNAESGGLYNSGVWNRAYGERIPDNTEKPPYEYADRGTVADLYINESDLHKYNELDELLARNGYKGKDSVTRLTNRILTLAANTFPSGTEFMHATQVSTLDKIVQRGALATRSTVAHGVRRATKNNGSFIHLTSAGGVAEEYGDVFIGVPVETVISNSPRMQLEDAYCGNSFSRGGKLHSTQEVMAGFVINDPMSQASPEVFRSALKAAHNKIEKGLRVEIINQGATGNYCFAATPDAQTAGRYSYPLEELSIYTDDPRIADKLATDYPDKADVIYRQIKTAHLIASGGGASAGRGKSMPQGHLSLPNFDLQGPVKVFAPVKLETVDFVESTAGGASVDGSSLELDHETIDPTAYPEFMTQLVDGGLAPTEIVRRAVDSVNHSGGSLAALVASFAERRAVYEGAGFNLGSIIGMASTERIKSELPLMISTLDDYSLKAEVAHAAAQSLSPEDQAQLVEKIPALEAYGYQLSAYAQEPVRDESDGWVF